MMGLLFMLSGIPGIPGPEGFWLADALEPNLQNALHVPLYAALQILWLRALAKPERSMLMTITMALILTCSYGIIDEFHHAAAASYERLLEHLRPALLLGLMERSLELTVSYTKERQAFGTPIAAFQSLQHRCADMLLRTESTRSAGPSPAAIVTTVRCVRTVSM